MAKPPGKFSGIDIDVNKTYGVATKARWNDFTLRYAPTSTKSI